MFFSLSSLFQHTQITKQNVQATSLWQEIVKGNLDMTIPCELLLIIFSYTKKNLLHHQMFRDVCLEKEKRSGEDYTISQTGHKLMFTKDQNLVTILSSPNPNVLLRSGLRYFISFKLHPNPCKSNNGYLWIGIVKHVHNDLFQSNEPKDFTIGHYFRVFFFSSFLSQTQQQQQQQKVHRFMTVMLCVRMDWCTRKLGKTPTKPILNQVLCLIANQRLV
jgi:hypothetical protein